jgi:glycosyltransferase involved in cell wall biosynthesis
MVALEVREEEGWGIHRPWGSLVERFGELRIVEKADVVVPVSAELDASLASAGVPGHKRLVLDNAVDLELFAPAGVGPEHRPPELGSRLVAGWVGSFQPFHGLRLLPDIARRLESEAPDVLLCLVGNGPLFETVAASVRGRSNVSMIGSVQHEDVPKWIRCFDMAFLLADDGAFHYSPLKLFEYLACGCPVVAARVGEVAQVISRERGGLLVPPGNADATADAIARLARDADLRQRMAAGARQVAEEGGSWRSRATTLLSFLEHRELL